MSGHRAPIYPQPLGNTQPVLGTAIMNSILRRYYWYTASLLDLKASRGLGLSLNHRDGSLRRHGNIIEFTLPPLRRRNYALSKQAQPKMVDNKTYPLGQ